MRYTPLFAAAAAITIAAPSAAQDHSVETVLAQPHRDDDRARDQYRHPAETLAFFGVESGMTVVEYGPGGGWYTRVLVPYIAPHGSYIAVDRDRGPVEEGTQGWGEQFSAAVTASGLAPNGNVAAFELDEIPESAVGTADRVLIFRSLHGMIGGNRADAELRAIRTLLADDGMVGVVQHRASEGAPFEYVNGSRGYLRQSDVVRLFELNGFELVDSSEINANPNDPSNWERGVWTLPPTFALGDENRDTYAAIGESDRMTLLFRKRD